MIPQWAEFLAEREGFEPSDKVSLVNSLAVSPIRPLSHLSKHSDLLGQRSRAVGPVVDRLTSQALLRRHGRAIGRVGHHPDRYSR